MKVLDPNLLTLRGTLRIRDTPRDGERGAESTKIRTLYHTLELGGDILSPGTGVSGLVATCAPTLCVLKPLHNCWSFSFPFMSS